MLDPPVLGYHPGSPGFAARYVGALPGWVQVLDPPVLGHHPGFAARHVGALPGQVLFQRARCSIKTPVPGHHP